MREPAPHDISPEEYLAFERASPTKHEYMDGVVYPWGDPDHPLDPDVVRGLRSEPQLPYTAMAGGTRAHSRIKVNLTAAIDNHLGDGPCRLYDSDLRMRPDHADYFYPDLFVVCADDPGADTDTEVDNPILVIEVLSPSTERIDRTSKPRRYANAPSLREYMLVNTRFPEITVRRLEDGRWITYTYEPDEAVHLESIGLDLTFATVYRNVRWTMSDAQP